MFFTRSNNSFAHFEGITKFIFFILGDFEVNEIYLQIFEFIFIFLSLWLKNDNLPIF